MGRLRNSRGQFISKYAQEGVEQISAEHGAKDPQKYFLENETEFRGLFSATNEAKFSSENAADYLNANFDKFKINNGEQTYNVGRNEAMKLISQFNNWSNKEGANFALFSGTMKDKDKDGQFHTLEINLPVNKNKGKGFRVSREKAETMEENGEIEYFKSDYKKKKKARSRNRTTNKRRPVRKQTKRK